MKYEILAVTRLARDKAGRITAIPERRHALHMHGICKSAVELRARELFPGTEVKVTPVLTKAELNRLTPEELIRALS